MVQIVMNARGRTSARTFPQRVQEHVIQALASPFRPLAQRLINFARNKPDGVLNDVS